jgi:BON domain-containing protein
MNARHHGNHPRCTLRALLISVVGISALSIPILSHAGTSDVNAVAFTHEDGGIVSAVKTRLAALHLDSVTDLKVVADAHGRVLLTGTAATQEAADRAIEAARNADGVEFVKADIMVVRNSH